MIGTTTPVEKEIPGSSVHSILYSPEKLYVGLLQTIQVCMPRLLCQNVNASESLSSVRGRLVTDAIDSACVLTYSRDVVV